MNNITDERLHELLTVYFQAEPERIPLFHPSEESEEGSATPILFLIGKKKPVIAAAILFTCILCISIFFLYGNKNTVSVSVVSALTEASASSISNIEGTSRSGEQNSKASAQPSGIASEQSTDSTVNETITEVCEEIPTDQKSTDVPSQSTDIPTELSSPVTESEEPTYLENPEAESGCTCDAQFPVDWLSGSENVYCRLAFQNGEIVGDPNFFSEQHIAHQSPQSDGTIFVVYYLYDLIDSGVNLPEGIYHFYFYGDSGVTVYHGVIEFQNI
ncbi:MAG: hypothetical protein IJJ15_01095 [Ruminococcus sp.]|nr:hypothetical protein [Ruminococcus sp.]